MAHSNETKHGLPLIIASDKPGWLTDWNEAMAKIDSLIEQTDVGTIDDIQKQVQQNTIDISSIKNKNTQQDSQIAENAGDIQALGSRVTALEQGSAGGTIPPDVQQQIDNNTKNTASNTAAISNIQSEIQNIKNVNDTQGTQIANLQTKDTQQDSVINGNTNSISNLQNRVSVLEQQGGGGSYTLPVATATTLGGVKIGSGINKTADGTISVPAAPGYTLPTATATRLGGIKVGSGLSVSADGTLSAPGGGGSTGQWEEDSSQQGNVVVTVYYNTALRMVRLKLVGEITKQSFTYNTGFTGEWASASLSDCLATAVDHTQGENVGDLMGWELSGTLSSIHGEPTVSNPTNMALLLADIMLTY